MDSLADAFSEHLSHLPSAQDVRRLLKGPRGTPQP